LLFWLAHCSSSKRRRKKLENSLKMLSAKAFSCSVLATYSYGKTSRVIIKDGMGCEIENTARTDNFTKCKAAHIVFDMKVRSLFLTHL